MIRTKKIAILAIIAMVFTLMPAALFAADSNRLAGADRIGTAIAIADAGWTTTADTVVLAPADQANLVDALAAAPLAGAADAPILLTFKSALNDDVKAKIAALGATKVYVVGAISADVVAEVDAMNGVTAEQLSGANRWATADAINAKLTSPAGTFVVGYNALADALSVASYAAANNYAIVLTKADGTVDASKLVGSKTYLVGGSAVVADYAGATRLSGADRFATNAAVAAGLTFSYDTVYVANGLSMVDALAAAPLAAKANAFVALASGSSVAADVESSNVIAVGGTAAVSDAVRASVLSGDLAVVSVSAINAKEIEVLFNKAVDDETVSEASFKIDDTAVSALDVDSTVALEDDDKTVTITLDDVDFLQNDQGYSVTVVKDGVEDISGEALSADYTDYFLFNDEDAPEVVSVTATAKDDTTAVKVKFNEPVAGNGTYKVDGIGASVTSGDKTDTLTLTSTTLEAGETYSIVIIGEEDISSDVNAMDDPVTMTFKVAGDTAAPTVKSVNVIAQSKLEVVFSEDIEEALIDVTDITFIMGAVAYNETSGLNNADFTVTKEDDDTFEIDISFNAGIFGDDDSKTVTFFLADEAVTDVYGNKFDGEYSKTLTLTKDEAGPVLQSIAVSEDSQRFELTFNEDLGGTSDETKIVVTDADGVRYTVDDASIDGTDGEVLIVDLNAVPAAMEDGTYTIKVNEGAIEDAYANDNVLATMSAVVDEDGDTTDPTVLTFGGTDNNFVVTYSEEVTAATALKASNYLLDGAALPSGSDIYFTDADKDTVNIDLPDGSIDGVAAATDATLTVRNVTDEAGNKIDITSSTGSDITIADNTKAILESAELVSNILILNFNEDLDNTLASSTSTTGALDAVMAEFAIEGDDVAYTDLADTATVEISGKQMIITITDVDGNWADIKAADVITVETVTSPTLTDENGTAVKGEVLVTVD